MIGANSLFRTPNIGAGISSRGCPTRVSIRTLFHADLKARSLADQNRRMDLVVGCFKVPLRKQRKKKIEVETVQGGVDVWHADTSEGKFPEHLVIMVNGIIGSAEDWRYAAEQFVKKLPDKVIVHRSECNYSRLTFDGVDLMGERLAEELPFLCGLPFLERRASQTAHWIIGRTGKHLFLTDNDDGRPPLLLQMVDDCNDLKFMSALCSFKRCVAYANANYDYMVGWRTSSIRRQHELPKHHLLVKDEKYPHIVFVERKNSEKIHNGASSYAISRAADLEEEMIRGLNQVSWERVDVSFVKSRQRYNAHNTIQVNSYWLNSDGADVVFHMIDNFLV